MAPNRKDPSKMTVHYMPCSPGDPDAIEKNWTEVASDELLEPELTLQDFLRSAATARPSVNQDDLAQYVKWTVSSSLLLSLTRIQEEFGQEG